MIPLVRVIAILILLAIALAYYYGFKRANKAAEKFWKQALQITLEAQREKEGFDYTQI